MGNGVKKLYYYPFPAAARDVHALLGRAGFISGIKPTKRDPGRARPGFRVISPAPGTARVGYYSVSRDSAACQLEMLAAYAGAARADGCAVTADRDSRELLITPAPSGVAA
jgi:hypothetical protein